MLLVHVEKQLYHKDFEATFKPQPSLGLSLLNTENVINTKWARVSNCKGVFPGTNCSEEPFLLKRQRQPLSWRTLILYFWTVAENERTVSKKALIPFPPSLWAKHSWSHVENRISSDRPTTSPSSLQQLCSHHNFMLHLQDLCQCSLRKTILT